MHNGHILCFDNVSMVAPAISDALCQISTGGGFGVRAVFTDAGEFLVAGFRPVILNGIENHITRSDLADRAVVLTLPPVTREGRRSESEFWARFATVHAQILGALLDAVVHGLRELPRVRLSRKSRMADFEMFAHACEGAFAAPGAFVRAFDRNAAETNAILIEADAVATAIASFMTRRRHWRGTAAELLRELTDHTEAQVAKSKAWPRDPTRFSGHLRAIAAILRKSTIEIQFDKAKDRKRTGTIDLRKIERKIEEEERTAVAGRSDAGSATGKIVSPEKAE